MGLMSDMCLSFFQFYVGLTRLTVLLPFTLLRAWNISRSSARYLEEEKEYDDEVDYDYGEDDGSKVALSEYGMDSSFDSELCNLEEREKQQLQNTKATWTELRKVDKSKEEKRGKTQSSGKKQTLGKKIGTAGFFSSWFGTSSYPVVEGEEGEKEDEEGVEGVEGGPWENTTEISDSEPDSDNMDRHHLHNSDLKGKPVKALVSQWNKLVEQKEHSRKYSFRIPKKSSPKISKKLSPRNSYRNYKTSTGKAQRTLTSPRMRNSFRKIANTSETEDNGATRSQPLTKHSRVAIAAAAAAAAAANSPFKAVQPSSRPPPEVVRPTVSGPVQKSFGGARQNVSKLREQFELSPLVTEKTIAENEVYKKISSKNQASVDDTAVNQLRGMETIVESQKNWITDSTLKIESLEKTLEKLTNIVLATTEKKSEEVGQDPPPTLPPPPPPQEHQLQQQQQQHLQQQVQLQLYQKLEQKNEAASGGGGGEVCITSTPADENPQQIEIEVVEVVDEATQEGAEANTSQAPQPTQREVPKATERRGNLSKIKSKIFPRIDLSAKGKNVTGSLDSLLSDNTPQSDINLAESKSEEDDAKCYCSEGEEVAGGGERSRKPGKKQLTTSREFISGIFKDRVLQDFWAVTQREEDFLAARRHNLLQPQVNSNTTSATGSSASSTSSSSSTSACTSDSE